MSHQENNTKHLKTCTIGAGFYLPAQQAWGTLNVFHAYQLILSTAFFFLFISGKGPALFGQTDKSLFFYTSLLYFSFTLLNSAFIKRSWPSFPIQIQLRITFDILFLLTLMHASGGITSGLGILLAISVAAGGLLAGGQCTLVFAALATLALLGEQIYADIYHSFTTTAYTYAAVLSTSFFTIALLAMVLAKRVEVTEEIVQQQDRDISDLEQLNSYIIDHLTSGIIVVDAQYAIRQYNKAASQLLGIMPILGTPLSSSSSVCWNLFNLWRHSTEKNIATMIAPNSLTRLELRFSQLNNKGAEAYVIFLDNLSAIDQQIRQGELASLGRLTASIAHEIRNPLGAISHAGQLLAESESIQQEDSRLLDIIHKHSERVNNIVKSILQLSRQEPIHSEPIQLAEWFSEFDKDFKEQFALAESPLKITGPTQMPSVYFDRNHLKQIVDNLCSNALKHGQSPANPTAIKIEFSEQKQTGLTSLSVSDNGPGIDKKIVAQIFEPFYTTSPSAPGLAFISLANSQNLMAQH